MENTNSEGLVENIKNFYRILTLASIDTLDTIYHPDVFFTDPAGSVRGLADLQNHFRRLLANTRQCSFEFFDDKQIVCGNMIFLCWRMTLVTPILAGGKPFAVDGASLLICRDGRIIEHRDYCDLGAMLYERLPLLGAVIRSLRRRLAAR